MCQMADSINKKLIMMTGADFANRLLQNIQTSLELRSRIPYLDILKELVQGGMPVSSAILNTSSNFGSFDSALKEVLAILNNRDTNFMPPPDTLPLPLTAIQQNLSDNMVLLSEVIQDYINSKHAAVMITSELLLYKLETINLAAV